MATLCSLAAVCSSSSPAPPSGPLAIHSRWYVARGSESFMLPPNKRLKLPGAHKQGGIALPRWLVFSLRLDRLAPAMIRPQLKRDSLGSPNRPMRLLVVVMISGVFVACQRSVEVRGLYANDHGPGNFLACDHPKTIVLISDSVLAARYRLTVTQPSQPLFVRLRESLWTPAASTAANTTSSSSGFSRCDRGGMGSARVGRPSSPYPRPGCLTCA